MVITMHIVGEPLKQNGQKRGQVVHLTNSFLIITLMNYKVLENACLLKLSITK